MILFDSEGFSGSMAAAVLILVPYSFVLALNINVILGKSMDIETSIWYGSITSSVASATSATLNYAITRQEMPHSIPYRVMRGMALIGECLDTTSRTAGMTNRTSSRSMRTKTAIMRNIRRS